jgi:radical SAM superfamily enzyme YgiQ (UPF0313 family)
MRISFVSVEDSIKAIGFRKVAAVARSIHPDTEVCYVTPSGMRAFFRLLFKRDRINNTLSDEDLKNIGNHLAKADIVCFSSMTPFADATKKIIAAIREINSKTYIVWGGIHPILNSEDAIQHADAICTGEGETAFQNFLLDYNNGKDYTVNNNFWFNVNGKILKNDFLPLQTSADMENFPLPLYADNEFIYKKGQGFAPLGLNEYLSFNDLVYDTVWSIGCPYKCTYCSNSRFIEKDKNYRKLRYPSIDYIIAEIKNVITKHPHISTIRFHDDSFMAIPSKSLMEFADKWKKEINIPFWIYGLIPIYVKKDKLQILVHAGMSRVRIGIQSGSNRILKFYKRPNHSGLIANCMETIGEFSKYMIAPLYDIIVDNPIETYDDILNTLDLIYNSPRPYLLYIYSLRAIPNTEMANDFARLNISVRNIDEGYVSANPTIANAMVYMLSVLKPPRWVYNQMLKHVKPYEKNPNHFFGFYFFRLLYKVRVAFDLIKSLDFSVFPGRFGWFMWQSGIIGFIQQRRMKKAWQEIKLVE